MGGFQKFLLRGNVVDLAVALVVGAAFGDVVKSLVKNFVTPLIGAFGGIPDFAAWYFTINNSRFGVGDFINTVIAFVVVAAVVYYFVVLPVQKMMDRYAPAPPPGTPAQEVLLAEIRDLLKQQAERDAATGARA